jgi:AcrR family transcriptional regulator
MVPIDCARAYHWADIMSIEKRKYELKARAQKLDETRQRIVEATVGLHRDIGPARTTVSEIARRAGVRRDTVYNHFPDSGELFAACGDYSMAQNPPPDLSAALALDAPAGRLHAVLTAFYSWYREIASGLQHLQRDRLVLPALDAAMRVRIDEPLAKLVDSLLAGFPSSDESRDGRRAIIAVALDFWTWRRLDREGLSDEQAAALMTAAAEAIAAPDSGTAGDRQGRKGSRR